MDFARLCSCIVVTIEAVWFDGLVFVFDKKHFHLFLKECEFILNHGVSSDKLKILRKCCEI